jgi:hypothetical protein
MHTPTVSINTIASIRSFVLLAAGHNIFADMPARRILFYSFRAGPEFLCTWNETKILGLFI